jgi:hypothetical protein
MNEAIEFKMGAVAVGNRITRLDMRWCWLLLGLAAWLTLSAIAQAATPDGDVGNGSTAEGTGALSSQTSGSYNTALGLQALFSNTTGGGNTGTGVNALFGNTTGGLNTANGVNALYSNANGYYNTASGFEALFSNTNGGGNTATGVNALFGNTTGSFNTATGVNALYSNIDGTGNTATGFEALFSNTTGTENTANGLQALDSNTTGGANTAAGLQALLSNISGNDNTAIGLEALSSNTTGSNNIAIGTSAGANLTTGDNNIDIGNSGVAAEANTIRIGIPGTQSATFIAGISGVAVTGTAVVVSSSGQLGVAPSSERFKEAIKPMDKASEAILALRPVTFRYKQEIDPKGIPQFGLVAEEVEQVNPDLVVHDAEGKVYSVRYEAVNAMLLNEFLKEHRKVEEQQATIAQLKAGGAKQEAVNAEQRKEMQLLAARLKKQESQIQKVSAQLEINSPQRAARLVDDTQ